MSKFSLVTKACGIFLLWAATAISLPAQTFTSLHSFDGTDGAEPKAPLVQAANGQLYGTTETGGSAYGGGGTFFAITTGGTLTTLSVLGGQNSGPEGPLIQATDGDFYGTAWGGDVTKGSVFRFTPGGTLTTLVSFEEDDIFWPEEGVVQRTDGDFYGTTARGGDNNGCDYDCGAVFKITPSGTLTTLYSFCSLANCADGTGPEAGLALGPDGNLYGTTFDGGGSPDDDGTLFKITPTGTLTTLHDFVGTDGAHPAATLVLGSDGNFYGTTLGGGNDTCHNISGCGTVFKITPSGTLTILYSFCSLASCADGDEPDAALIQGTDGNFYGTSEYGGGPNCQPDGCGTIFKITPSGALTTLYDMCSQPNCTDGITANALVQDTNGTFYGTTVSGGPQCGPDNSTCGTVFSLSVGLGPFERTNPVAGKVGSNVGILGTNLTGATGVKFNGTETAFRVVSSTFIEAKVPSGATTGTVQVQLPGGTLSSNVLFVVLR